MLLFVNAMKNWWYLSLFVVLFVSCTVEKKEAFIDKLMPAPKEAGFMRDGYWIWGSSVIKGEDGKYHMFADMWPQSLEFGNWVTNTEIAHAVSDTPEGPYVFSDIAIGPRDSTYFDGKCAMNPRVIYYEGKYYLFYVGTTYDYPRPQPGSKLVDDWFEKAWVNKRIGVASAKSLHGPWERMDKPVIEPRPGHWDATITSNPSPVVNPKTGKIFLMYKSSEKSSEPPLLLGVAEADHPQGEYHRISENPIFQFATEKNKESDVEDPFVWWEKDHYELVMKDRFGHICGEVGGGVHAVSENGIDWTLSSPVKAYSRTIRWNDNTVSTPVNFERPFILFEDGKPAYLFAAVGVGRAQWDFEKTWNMVIPLKK